MRALHQIMEQYKHLQLSFPLFVSISYFHALSHSLSVFLCSCLFNSISVCKSFQALNEKLEYIFYHFNLTSNYPFSGCYRFLLRLRVKL